MKFHLSFKKSFSVPILVFIFSAGNVIAQAQSPADENSQREQVLVEDSVPVRATGEQGSRESDEEGGETNGWLDISRDWLLDSQEFVSRKVQDTAIGIDRYISRDSFNETLVNDSYIRLRFIERIREIGGNQSEARISGKIDLPSSKRKIKLIFDTDPDDFDSLEQKQRGLDIGENLSDKNKEDATVGVALEEEIFEKWKVNLGAGIRLRSALDPYTRLRFTRYDDINENWSSRYRETFFYFDSKSWGAESEADYYRPLDDDRLVHLSFGAKFLDTDNNWEYISAVSLNRRLDRNNALEYQVGVSANSKPSRKISNYWLRSKWQHRLYSDWLYFSVVPELSFPREENFDATFVINFELELFFSKDPDLRNKNIRY